MTVLKMCPHPRSEHYFYWRKRDYRGNGEREERYSSTPRKEWRCRACKREKEVGRPPRVRKPLPRAPVYQELARKPW